MQGGSPTKASTPTGAVFLSYASEDAVAAHRIAEALRAAGVEVWFDQSELRGGDAWDQSIRKQIRTCALFLPVISHTTHDRREGYFRLEWKLAIDRCHLMDANLAFLLPVVIDDTSDDDERVPERFREVQWTRLPEGETSLAFAERVQRLLSGEASPTIRTGGASRASPAVRGRPPATARSRRVLPVAVGVVALGAMAYVAIDRPWISKPPAAAPTLASPASAAFTPPPHSIAVLPFANMSGDKEQEYFSDGLTEELLNSLARINELQVAARTSSFSFQGQHPDIGTVAHKLNVAAVLEGSVRRSGHTVRISAQLINASTGFQLWSQTYDRDLGDVLALQAEIATAVAGALKATLLAAVSTKIELGGTRNPAAFDAYLRASKAYAAQTAQSEQSAIAGYSEAIRLDPKYALVFAARSIALTNFAWHDASGDTVRDALLRAQGDARESLTLAPELAEGHLALAAVHELGELDFDGANSEYERAAALAPGNARVLMNYGSFLALMGRTEAGLATLRRAVLLDPLSSNTRGWLAYDLLLARRYDEAAATYRDALAINGDDPYAPGLRGFAHYLRGDLQSARLSCEVKAATEFGQVCLAMTYYKLGQLSHANAIIETLRSSRGDAVAYEFTRIYAQRGDSAAALRWLNKALRLRSPWLEFVKMDPLLDPLRKEPRFKAIERELKFPD